MSAASRLVSVQPSLSPPPHGHFTPPHTPSHFAGTRSTTVCGACWHKRRMSHLPHPCHPFPTLLHTASHHPTPPHIASHHSVLSHTLQVQTVQTCAGLLMQAADELPDVPLPLHRLARPHTHPHCLTPPHTSSHFQVRAVQPCAGPAHASCR